MQSVRRNVNREDRVARNNQWLREGGDPVVVARNSRSCFTNAMSEIRVSRAHRADAGRGTMGERLASQFHSQTPYSLVTVTRRASNYGRVCTVTENGNPIVITGTTIEDARECATQRVPLLCTLSLFCFSTRTRLRPTRFRRIRFRSEFFTLLVRGCGRTARAVRNNCIPECSFA